MSPPNTIASEKSVAVVGAGIIGLSIAWRLAQMGWRVRIFDKGAVGREASWAGAGMLSPGGEVEGPSEFATLAIESRRLYAGYVRELEQAWARRIDYLECGALEVAYGTPELEALESRAEARKSGGIWSERLTQAQVAAKWPRLRLEGLSGARFYPDDGTVNPRELVNALEVACRTAGASIVPGCEVVRIDLSEAAVTLHTAQGTEEHSIAVVAAGAWSSRIEISGVPRLPSSEPVKGHLIGYAQPEHTCATIVRCGHTYLLERANGLLIVGSSIEHVGFDSRIDPEIVRYLASQAAYVFPQLSSRTPSETWTGFRPGSDSLHIGTWHSPRLHIAYGHYRNGILLAPLTARRVADEISASFERQ